MKQFDAGVGGQKSSRSWANGFAGAMAACALIAASGAKADVIETFNLSGSLSGFPFGSAVPFTGTFDLDFSNHFAKESLKSINITVHGHSVFNQGLPPPVGTIGASNSDGDTLVLWFAAPPSGTWAGFDAGEISFGLLVFGDLTGSLFGANGVVSRDLSDPPILDPPILDPPPVTSPAVPELSTWAMMLLGLAGLGLAARGRRAIGFLGGRA
jgi:hypothetical protein